MSQIKSEILSQIESENMIQIRNGESIFLQLDSNQNEKMSSIES